MQKLTPAGQNIINDLSNRYNLSIDAVVQMLVAVSNGGGTMAQFYCPELGGGGQWMRGGMIMVGDMFNNGLKNTVDNLCCELSNALASTQMFPVIPAGTPGSSQWWPAELGVPFSSGGQNNIRYAVFPLRLAVELNGQVTVYDTLDHNIGGISQQQGGDTSLTFSSQYGTISVLNLPLISGPGMPQPVQSNFAQPVPQYIEPVQSFAQNAPGQNPIPNANQADLLNLLEKLAQLRDAGVLSADEFNSKKMDLLARI